MNTRPTAAISRQKYIMDPALQSIEIQFYCCLDWGQILHRVVIKYTKSSESDSRAPSGIWVVSSGRTGLILFLLDLQVFLWFFLFLLIALARTSTEKMSSPSNRQNIPALFCFVLFLNE